MRRFALSVFGISGSFVVRTAPPSIGFPFAVPFVDDAQGMVLANQCGYCSFGRSLDLVKTYAVFFSVNTNRTGRDLVRVVCSDPLVE